MGDVLKLFSTKLLNLPFYDARSDPSADHDNDVGDVLKFFSLKILTRCATLTFTNSSGSAVDDIHIQWSAAVAAVFVARDSQLQGWSNRALSGDGLTLDMDRPDPQGDLPASAQLTVVVQSASMSIPSPSSCQWTLDGANQGAC